MTTTAPVPTPALDDPGAHLAPAAMARAQRELVAKILGELTHERLLDPTPRGDGYVLETGGGRVVHRFRAHRHALEHWVVEPGSVERRVEGRPEEPDAQRLLVELAPVLGIPGELLPVYLEEVAATLAASAWKHTHRRTPVAELLGADLQRLEAAMTQGHPSFVANSARLGFGLDDHAAYAPEAGAPVRLHWLAARRAHTHLACGHGVQEDLLYREELGEEVLDRFAARLTGRGLDPDDYLYLPVHPWQWTNKVAISFAPDLGRADLVHLGEGPDEYQAQQSVRTFFNRSHPGRHYVKTALAVQNMGFLRGLSPAYMRATPAINDWVFDLVAADPTLGGCGFEVLRERASIGYTGDVFHALPDPCPQRRMLAALWRESPVPRLGGGERAATMASLLHRDHRGDALVTAMVAAAPVDARTWVRSYLRAYVRPLVHCLLRYDLAFMPHGENVILVLRDHVPVRVLMKDIGEEVAVMGDLPLPPGVERIRGRFSQDVRSLALHTDVLDGFLRHLAAVLHDDGVLAADELWGLVAECLHEHERDHPDLAAAAARYDLFRPTFRHSCLNRLQLRNTLQMVDLTDQEESLAFAGEMDNPLARFRRG